MMAYVMFVMVIGMAKNKEVWKDIKGYEGVYQISNNGNLKSLERKVRDCKGERIVNERFMKFTVRSGYYNVVLRKQGHRESKQIHRLVAEAFIPNPNNFPIVNHKDHNRKNNCVANLEWCTQKHNVGWSRDKMCKPKRKTYSLTGEKYISKYGDKYRVCIARFNIDKKFKLLLEAINYRNKVVKNEREYFERG